MMPDSNLDKFEYERELAQDPRKGIRFKYRELFSSELGRQVLTDFLENAEFGSILHPEDTVRLMWHNAAISILRECGMIGPGLMDQLVDAFCSVYKEG